MRRGHRLQKRDFQAPTQTRRNNMKAKLIAVTIAGALTLGTLAAYAHDPGHGPRMFRHCGFGGGNAVEHLTKELDLTPEQQAQLAPIVEQAKPQIKAIHEEAMQKTRAV